LVLSASIFNRATSTTNTITGTPQCIDDPHLRIIENNILPRKTAVDPHSDSPTWIFAEKFDRHLEQYLRLARNTTSQAKANSTFMTNTLGSPISLECVADGRTKVGSAEVTAEPDKIWNSDGTKEKNLIIEYNTKGIVTVIFVLFAAAWLRRTPVEHVCTDVAVLTAAHILLCVWAGEVFHYYLAYGVLVPFEVTVTTFITLLLLGALCCLVCLCLHLCFCLYSALDFIFNMWLQLYNISLSKLASALFSIRGCLLLMALVPVLHSCVSTDTSSVLINQGETAAALPSLVFHKFNSLPAAGRLFLTSHATSAGLMNSSPRHAHLPFADQTMGESTDVKRNAL
jgi:hypothetical protein